MKATRPWFFAAALGVLATSTTFLAAGVSFAADDDAVSADDAVSDADDDVEFFPEGAQAARRAPKAKLADLAGSWAISLGGHTGCGLMTLYVTVNLDASGSGSARTISSSTGCPPGDDPAHPFQILSLNADGSGTAGLSCGPGCGWVFTIQVPRDNTNLFTLVDVARENPNNVLVGTAARKW